MPDPERTMAPSAEAATMARKKATPKTVHIKLTEEAMRLARIAAGYSGESASEYVSRIVEAQAAADVERLHSAMTRPGKGKGGKP